MKIIILHFLFCFFYGIGAFAQVNIGMDFTLMGSYANYKNTEYLLGHEKQFQPGFDIGFLTEVEIVDFISLQVALKYGNRRNSIIQAQVNASEMSYQMHYLHTPILLKLKLSKGPVQWFTLFGPDIHYMFAGHINYSYFDGSQQSFSDSKFGFYNSKNSPIDFEVQDINRWQLGLVIGTGLEWKVMRHGKFIINVQYNAIHTFLSENQNQGPYHPDITSDFRFGLNALGLNIAYLHNFTSILKNLRK